MHALAPKETLEGSAGMSVLCLHDREGARAHAAFTSWDAGSLPEPRHLARYFSHADGQGLGVDDVNAVSWLQGSSEFPHFRLHYQAVGKPVRCGC